MLWLELVYLLRYPLATPDCLVQRSCAGLLAAILTTKYAVAAYGLSTRYWLIG